MGSDRKPKSPRSLYGNIGLLLEQSGMSARALAKVIEIDPSTITRLGPGSSADTIRKIADHFGVSEDFVRGEVNPTPVSSVHWNVKVARERPNEEGSMQARIPGGSIVEVGDNGLEPDYIRGEFLICSGEDQPQPGDVVGLRHEGLFVARIYHRQGNRHIFFATSPGHEQITLDEMPEDCWPVVGKLLSKKIEMKKRWKIIKSHGKSRG